jgi:hypothetical protein
MEMGRPDPEAEGTGRVTLPLAPVGIATLLPETEGRGTLTLGMPETLGREEGSGSERVGIASLLLLPGAWRRIASGRACTLRAATTTTATDVSLKNMTVKYVSCG